MTLTCVKCFVIVFSIHLALGSFTSCIHGGTKYKDGDYFLPNKTFIKTVDPFQCVQCRCHRGMVVCEIENCTLLDCEKPVKYSQFCCLRCPGNTKSYQESSDFVFGLTSSVLPPRNKHKTTCLSNGQNYANGSVWQPVIGPFGTMACVQCQCREGNVVCTRLRCNNQPCSHPKREFGECCPVCFPSENENEFSVSCLPKASELLVFKTPNVGNDSEIITYGFVENTSKDKAIALYVWNLRSKSSLNVLTVKMSGQQEVEKWNLKLLGSVSQKRFKKFSQRCERLRRKCFVQCLRKITRLENSLGIYPVVTRKECTENEIDVSNF